MAEPDSCRKSEYGENKEGQEGSTVSTTKTEDAGSDQGDSRGTDKNLLLEGSCQNMGDTEDRDEATATKEQSEVDGSSQSLTTDAGGSDADKTSPEAVKVCECDGEEITDPAKPDDTDGQQAERPAVTEQVDSSDQQQSLGPTEQADAKKQQEPHSTVQDEADKTHNESSANLTNTDIQQDPCQSQAKEDGKDNQQQEPNQQEPSQRISDQVSDDHQGEATGEVSVQDKMDSQEENPAKSDTDQRGSDPSQTEQEGSSDHQDLPNLQEPPQKTAEQTSIENKQETEGDIKEKNEDDSKEHKEETGKETTSESKEKEDSGPEELKETSERKIVDKKDDESSKEATNESKKKEEDGPGELKEMSEGKIGDKGGDGSKEHKEETSKETSESEIKEKKEDDLKELEKESSKETRESKKTDNSEASSVVSNTKTGSTKKSGKNYNAAGNLYDGWGRGASNTFSVSFFKNLFCPVCFSYRLVGLVVRCPPRERKIPGSNPACARIFSGWSHTIDSKIGTPVASLPGARRYRVSTGTGRPSVSILWLGEVESWICNFYLSVAARKIVWADPSLRYTSMLLGC